MPVWSEPPVVSPTWPLTSSLPSVVAHTGAFLNIQTFLGLFILLFYVCEHLPLHVCVCATLMPSTLEGQKKASDPLELELWMVVNQHWELKK